MSAIREVALEKEVGELRAEVERLREASAPESGWSGAVELIALRAEVARLREENAALRRQATEAIARRDEAWAEAARQALLVQRYEPAYLGLPHVVRERDEARAQTLADRAFQSENGRLKAEVARLRKALSRIDDEAGCPAAEYVPALPRIWEIARAALRGGGMGHALPDQQCSAIEHKALKAEVERLRGVLGLVLIETGLQAHKHGCPERLRRPAQWDQTLPCAGCAAEAALRGGGEPCTCAEVTDEGNGQRGHKTGCPVLRGGGE